MSNLYLEFFDNKGSGIRIAKSDIDYIEIDGQKINHDKIAMLNSNSYCSSYPSTGVLLGTPAALNVLFGYDFANDFGLRACGGRFFQSMIGGEANVLYSLRPLQNSVSLALSFLQTSLHERMQEIILMIQRS